MCPLGMAISVVSAGEQKREIASQLVLSSRAERGDLGCSGLDKQTKERLLRR